MERIVITLKGSYWMSGNQGIFSGQEKAISLPRGDSFFDKKDERLTRSYEWPRGIGEKTLCNRLLIGIRGEPRGF